MYLEMLSPFAMWQEMLVYNLQDFFDYCLNIFLLRQITP